MNVSIAFDTLKASNTLQATGIQREQAAAIDDILNVKDVASGRGIADLRREMAEMETRMTKAMYNALIGFAAVIAAVVIGPVSVPVIFLAAP